MLTNPRSIVVSKIRFYEKMARKTRKTALKNWNSGASKLAAYEASLSIADRYDDYVLKLTNWLREEDERLL